MSSGAGNPGRDIEGALFTLNESPNLSGGVLSIVSSTPGALFTFQGLDASATSTINPVTGQPFTLSISLLGFRQGNQVAGDIYSLTGDTMAIRSWHAETAVDLAGRPIDELRIQLPGFQLPFVVEAWANIDNVALDPVATIPEAGSATLLGIGLASLGIAVRRRLIPRGVGAEKRSLRTVKGEQQGRPLPFAG